MGDKKILYTYALVKTLYDRGKDLLDSFWPFVIRVFPEDEFVEVPYLQEQLLKKYHLDMPIHVLSMVLKRASRQKYLLREKKRYKLTPKGIKELENLETEREAERRINQLLEDVRRFFEEKGVSLNKREVEELLFNFIWENIDPLIEFFSSSTPPTLNPKTLNGKFESILVEYINKIENSNPTFYKTFQDVIYGSLISSTVYAKNYDDINEMRNKKIKKWKVFLDTNFVFSILELNSIEFAKPARELFDLLKKLGFSLNVFDFTVDEMCKVIRGYLDNYHKYPISVKVDSIYSNLRRKGWGKAEVTEFVSNVENILMKMGITLVSSNINLKNYSVPNEKIRYIMRAYKPDQTEYHQNHDLAAIQMIAQIRGRRIRKIEEAKAIFLTSDIRLSKFNFDEMGHKENGTVPEVILDRLLTNILWLKNPNLNIPVRTIISMHSRDLFVKKKVWDKFYKVLKDLRQKGEIEDKDVSTLFYHGYIEEVLLNVDEEESYLIDKEFVINKIEEAAKFKEKEISEKYL